MDPNTAYRQLYLSRGNRKAALKRDPQSYPDHPARFDSLPQVLCMEPLSGGAYYWEVDWSGEGAAIGVTYKGIKRTGYGDSCRIGYNRKSWSLFCSDASYSARHNKDQLEVTAPYSSRIGVFLDHAGGTLSFYTIGDSMSLIHRFKTSFSEAVYPGFWVWYESAVTLIQLWLKDALPIINDQCTTVIQVYFVFTEQKHDHPLMSCCNSLIHVYCMYVWTTAVHDLMFYKSACVQMLRCIKWISI